MPGRPARPRRTPYVEYAAHGTHPGELPLYRRLQHVAARGRLLWPAGSIDFGPVAQPLDHGDLRQEHDATEAGVGPQRSKTAQIIKKKLKR